MQQQKTLTYINSLLGYQRGNAQEESHRARRSWWDPASWVQAVCHEVQVVANVVEKVVSVVGWVAQFLTGNTQGTDSINFNLFGFNYDLQSNGPVESSMPIGNGFVCENCYSYINLEVDFQFTVQSHVVNMVSLTGGGAAGLFIDVAWGPYVATSELDWSKIVATPSFSHFFTIGPVPFNIKASLPVQVGGLLDVTTSGEFRARTAFSGQASFGIEYTPADGFMPVNNVEFAHSAQVVSLNAAVDVRTQFYVMPVLKIDVDYVGESYLSLKGFLEMQVSESLRQQSVCPQSCTISAGTQTNVGLDANVGAAINISIAGKNLLLHKFGNATILSLKKPVMSACICLSDVTSAPPDTGETALSTTTPTTTTTTSAITPTTPNSSDSSPFEPSVMVVGDVWSGMSLSDLPSCALVNNVSVSLQLVQLNSALTQPEYFVGKINGWSEASGAPCLAQMLLQVDVEQVADDQVCTHGNAVYLNDPCLSGTTQAPDTTDPSTGNSDSSGGIDVASFCSNVAFNRCTDGSSLDILSPYLSGCLDDTQFQSFTLYDKFGNPCFTINMEHVTGNV